MLALFIVKHHCQSYGFQIVHGEMSFSEISDHCCDWKEITVVKQATHWSHYEPERSEAVSCPLYAALLGNQEEGAPAPVLLPLQGWENLALSRRELVKIM